MELGDKVIIEKGIFKGKMGQVLEKYISGKYIVMVGEDKLLIEKDWLSKKEEIMYPNDFRKFNGVEIDNTTIESWLRQLKNSENDADYFCSGNTIVIKMGNHYIVAEDFEKLVL